MILTQTDKYLIIKADKKFLLRQKNPQNKGASEFMQTNSLASFDLL